VWLIDGQVGEDSIEQDRPAGEIGSAVADSRHCGQSVKALENLPDYPVRCLQPFAFEKIKPNGVDIEKSLIGKLKWLQMVLPAA
jgi:hypothetical protein